MVEAKFKALRKAMESLGGKECSAVVFCESGMMHLVLPMLPDEGELDSDGPAMRATVSGMIHHEANHDLWRMILDRMQERLKKIQQGEVVN